MYSDAAWNGAVRPHWDEELDVEAVYHEVPARYGHDMARSDSEDELLGIEEVSYLEWNSLASMEDRGDLASEPSTSSRVPKGTKGTKGEGAGVKRWQRATKRKLLAGCRQAHDVWKKAIIPSSSLPELLAQREEMQQRIKEIIGQSKEARVRWHRAFDMAMEGHENDRALRNVRDISNRIRQHLFFSESQNSLLKVSSMMHQYDQLYDRKRFGRLTASLCDLTRLAHPIRQLIDARTFECHDVVQHELSSAVQQELSRRAEPLELQRWEREVDGTKQQSEVGRKSVNKKLDDMQRSIHRTAHNASSFMKNVKKTLQTLANDIHNFGTSHADLKKAERNYWADFYEQQRRNEGYQDALEKLTARRKLQEARLQSDLETLRSEHTILKRSLETLEKLHEENKTRAAEIASWLQVLSGQRIEKNADLMLEVHESRMIRRQAFFKRINWLELRRLNVEVDKLRKQLRNSSETLRQSRLKKDVEVYRSITGDAKVLLLELRQRCKQLRKDGTLKDDLVNHPIAVHGFFDVIAKELCAHAEWLRSRHMAVRLSGETLTLARSLRLTTPISILSVADKLLHQRQLKMMVITEMRRASVTKEEKVQQLTKRFTLALLSRRHSHHAEESSESFDDSEDEIERISEGIDIETLRQIIRETYPESDVPLATDAATATDPQEAKAEHGSVEDALAQLQHLSPLEDQLHHALAHLLHHLHGESLEELHDLLKSKLQDTTEAWHIAVTAAHAAPEVEEENSLARKIRSQRFAWLVPLVQRIAQHFGHLRAVHEVLWAVFERDDSSFESVQQKEQAIHSVTSFLRSLDTLATEDVIKAGEACLQRLQQVQHGKMTLLKAASDACAHLRNLPDINVVPTDGTAEAIPLGPSPHTFVTAIKALSKLLSSDAFAEAQVFEKFTESEILHIVLQAVTRDFKTALPECFRAATLALADVGQMFQDYQGDPMDRATSSATFCASETPKETWRALRAEARQRMEGGTPASTPIDRFQMDSSRPLLSRERAQTASSRPWTSTPLARPNTEDSTRLPSRIATSDLASRAEFAREGALSPVSPEGRPLDQQDLQFEMEKERLLRAKAEQEEDLRRLQDEQKDTAARVAFLRKSVSQVSQSSEAWRVGELMEELELAEEGQRAIQDALDERQKVAQLLKEQGIKIGEQQELHRERSRILRSQSLMPATEESGKAKSLAWARSMSRLTAIENKMGQLSSELSEQQGATSALEATVATLERQKSQSDGERLARSNQLKEVKIYTQEEMVSAYTTRVAMRSLWKVQGHKLLQAQKAAEIYCKKLLRRHQATVLFEEDDRAKSGKAGSKKRGSLPRSAVTTTRTGKRGSKVRTTPTSPGPKVTRASLKKATLPPKHPHPTAAQRSEEQNIFVGQAQPKEPKNAHGGARFQREAAIRRNSTRRMSRASIESRSSVDAALMDSVLSIGQAARAATVPVISVHPPTSPSSSADTSSSSATESAAESATESTTVIREAMRRPNVMTDLLATKALRSQVQASLGEEELQQSNQWAEDWIRRMSRQDENPTLDGHELMHRTGLTEISALAADATLGPSENPLSDSDDAEVLQRDPETVEHFIQSSAAATVKPKQAQPRLPLEAGALNLRGPRVLFSKDSSRAKGPKAKAKPKNAGRSSTAKDKQEVSSPKGFLSDPLVTKLKSETSRGRSIREQSQISSRREVSTSTTREPGEPEGLQQEDSLMAFSSVHSTEKYSYLSHRAISEAVADDPRARRTQRRVSLLPRLVAVRMDGPGDAAASQYAEKGRKGVLSAAMTQAARMQRGNSKSSRPASKQEMRGGNQDKIDVPQASVDNYVELSQAASVVRFLQEDKEVTSGLTPKLGSVKSGGNAKDRADELTPTGWSQQHGGEIAGRSSRSAGSVLTTRPRECKPMLTARAKKYFNGGGASLR